MNQITMKLNLVQPSLSQKNPKRFLFTLYFSELGPNHQRFSSSTERLISRDVPISIPQIFELSVSASTQTNSYPMPRCGFLGSADTKTSDNRLFRASTKHYQNNSIISHVLWVQASFFFRIPLILFLSASTVCPGIGIGCEKKMVLELYD